MTLEDLNSTITRILKNKYRSVDSMVSDCHNAVDEVANEWAGNEEFDKFRAMLDYRIFSAVSCCEVPFGETDRWYTRALSSELIPDYWRVSAGIIFCQRCLEKRRTKRALLIAEQLKAFTGNRPELTPNREVENIDAIIAEARERMKKTAETRKMRRKQR